MQGIDRLRLVRGDAYRQVFILTSIPVDITVDYLWNWDHLQEFLELWEESHGVLPLGAEDLLRLLPDRIGSIPGAKKVAGKVKGIQLLIDILISDRIHIGSYKTDPHAPGRPNTALISSSHKHPQEALERCLGRPVALFEIEGEPNEGLTH